MADTAQDPMSLGGREALSPYIDDGFVQVDNETHVLNYDTNILNLDDNREVSPGADMDCDSEIPRTSTESVDHEEDADIELSPGGILDEETVGRGLSNLGRSADGKKHVFLNCTIPGFNLIDIAVLASFTELQKVEIPYNQLTDLSPLNNLPYLLILDASHNKLTTILDFTPPKNLKEVDLSFNEIEEMSDLSAHHCLAKLNLDNNSIKEIKGLENCHRLKNLSVAHNKIEKIQGLDRLPIQYLNLCHNHLTRIENIESLRLLRQVNFSGNKIRSLSGIEDHDLLETVDLEDNEVIDITEMKYIMELQMLRQLNLLRNPIQELPDYRLSILFRLQRLTELDRHKVEVEEKVASINMFNPSPEVIAARDHIMHVVYSFLQPSRVWDSTLPSIETPYPMLVLVGPQGSGKKDLAIQLVEEFSDYFGYGVSHSTRKPHPEETAGKDYHFVTLDKFEMDIKMFRLTAHEMLGLIPTASSKGSDDPAHMCSLARALTTHIHKVWMKIKTCGQFIQTYQYGGDFYGLQMESVECVAREGLACAVHMELEGVLTLKNTYFEPRYVLVLPLNEECHEKRMRDRGIYTEPQIEHTLSRAELYKTYNQMHPGFFDMMINSDDIQEAYKRLRRLVMDYLGIGVNSPPNSEIGDTDGRGDTTDVNITTQMGTRTWSKPSISESMSQTFPRSRNVQSPIPSGRGIVEEASLKRRQSAAKEAVAGTAPPLLEQLLTSYPKTAPQSVEGQMGLGSVIPDTLTENQRSFSAPVKKVPRPGSSETSSDRTGASSSLSGLTSASDIQRERAKSPEAAPDKGPQLPTEMVNPLELMSEPSIEPKPMSNQKPNSQGSRNRPGSDKHKVLPPISPNSRLVELK